MDCHNLIILINIININLIYLFDSIQTLFSFGLKIYCEIKNILFNQIYSL